MTLKLPNHITVLPLLIIAICNIHAADKTFDIKATTTEAQGVVPHACTSAINPGTVTDGSAEVKGDSNAGDCRETSLSIMHLNVWKDAKVGKTGFSEVISEVDRVDPDIVMFSEAHNREDDFYLPAFLDSLKVRGKTYYGIGSGLDVQMVSKYPVIEQEHIVEQQNGSMRSILDINGRKAAVYTAHLDYTHYECYLPRGYSGTTWKKIDAPVTDTDVIMKANDESYRDDAIRLIIEDAKSRDVDLILLGGDFNEPSHLDWGEDTRNLWDHNGAVVPWSC